MKLKTFATALTVTAATLIGVSAAQAHEVEYGGDARAAAICKAIVEDNAVDLKIELRKAAREHRNTRVAPATERHFECNGQSLTAFADDSGARKVSAYLDNTATGTTVAQN